MKYTLTQNNIVSILKVIGWSVASAFVAALIMVMEQTEFPPQYVFVVPLINVLLYALKEFVSSK